MARATLRKNHAFFQNADDVFCRGSLPLLHLRGNAAKLVKPAFEVEGGKRSDRHLR